jgi:hypothetical protein
MLLFPFAIHTANKLGIKFFKKNQSNGLIKSNQKKINTQQYGNNRNMNLQMQAKHKD